MDLIGNRKKLNIETKEKPYGQHKNKNKNKDDAGFTLLLLMSCNPFVNQS